MRVCPNCQASVSSSPGSTEPELEQQISELLRDAQKIAAIKVYREATGASLAEAKEAVERFQAEGTLPARDTSDTAWESEVLRLLVAGRKIPAIKLYRQQQGVGLKEAKESVEALARQHGIDMRGSGCFSVLLVMVVPTALAAAGACYFIM